MSKYLVQNPISAGQLFGNYNASAVNDTDWHTLTSDEFYSSNDGSQFADNLKFAYIGVSSSSSSTVSYIKLRAADTPTDGVANSDGVIAILGKFSIDVQALADANVTSIAYKKAAAGDSFSLYCGFNR